MTAWYAVYTQPRMELWARSNLWERDLEVYLPLYLKQRRHARKTDWVSMPLFPRYLFVRADLQAGDRRRIMTARGIADMVTFGDCTARVPNRVIEEIRAREDEKGYVRLCNPNELQPGEVVRLHDGAMSERTGLFLQMADNDRVVLLLDMLGRQVKVSVSAASVARMR